MARDGLCIVVTPLIALMKDQVDRLRRLGIRATAIHSGLSTRQIDIALDNCVYGDVKFLYVAPERLATEAFRLRVVRMNVSLIAVDEAHCISQWGYDFRPDYLQIASMRVLVDAPCSCLGTLRRHPDVLLRRGADSVKEIAALQRDILSVVVRYLKKGGVLIYSTCTVTEEENEQNADFIERELGLKPEVLPIARKNDGRLSLPPRDEWDGFFIARFRK